MFGLPTPLLTSLISASSAAYKPSTATALGLSAFADSNGNPITMSTANGVTAYAYQDAQGQIIVAYQGTTTSISQLSNDLSLAQNITPQAAFVEGDTFYEKVVARAKAESIPQSIGG